MMTVFHFYRIGAAGESKQKVTEADAEKRIVFRAIRTPYRQSVRKLFRISGPPRQRGSPSGAKA